jgi:chaperone modulatory protein CbpM
MTMERREFLLRARIDPAAVEVWIDDGWLAPTGVPGEWSFTEVDLARMRLIQDLTEDLGVNDEGIPIILGLVDQLHALRRALRDALMVLRAQPESARKGFAAELHAVRFERSR